MLCTCCAYISRWTLILTPPCFVAIMNSSNSQENKYQTRSDVQTNTQIDNKIISDFFLSMYKVIDTKVITPALAEEQPVIDPANPVDNDKSVTSVENDTSGSDPNVAASDITKSGSNDKIFPLTPDKKDKVQVINIKSQYGVNSNKQYEVIVGNDVQDENKDEVDDIVVKDNSQVYIPDGLPDPAEEDEKKFELDRKEDINQYTKVRRMPSPVRPPARVLPEYPIIDFDDDNNAKASSDEEEKDNSDDLDNEDPDIACPECSRNVKAFTRRVYICACGYMLDLNYKSKKKMDEDLPDEVIEDELVDSEESFLSKLEKKFGVTVTLLRSMIKQGWKFGIHLANTLYRFVLTFGDKIKGMFKFFETLLSSVIFARQIMISTSFEQVALATTQYVLFLGEKYRNFVQPMIEHGTKVVSDIKSKIKSESLSDFIDEYRGLTEKVLGGEFVVLLRRLLLSVVSYDLTGKGVSRKIMAYLGKPEKKIALIDLLPIMMRGFHKFVQGMEAIYAGAPICDVLFAPDAVDAAMDSAKKLLEFEDRLYTGLATKGRMCQREWYLQADLLVKSMAVIIKDMHAYDKRDKPLKELKFRIENKMAAIDSFAAASNRVPPLAVCLHGTPGIGKSRLLNLFPMILSALKGREFNEDQIYSRARTTQYWEGYLPWSHPFIHYSEVGNEAKKLVQSQGSPIITELNSLIDGTRFSCDMAFEDKGKVFAKPELVMVDTNNPNMNIDYLVNNGNAIRRRFLFVEAIVRPEFRKQGSTALDTKKSLEEGGNMLDRYIFNVYTYVPLDKASVKRTLVDRGNLVEMMAAVREHFMKFILAEQEVVSDDIYKPVRDILDNMNVAQPPPVMQGAVDIELAPAWMMYAYALVTTFLWTCASFMLVKLYEAEPVLRVLTTPILIIVGILSLRNKYLNFLCIIVFILAWMNKDYIVQKIKERVRNEVYNQVRSFAAKKRNKLQYMLGLAPLSPLNASMDSSKFATVCVVLASVRIIYALFKRVTKADHESHTSFKLPNAYASEMNRNEDYYECDTAIHRVYAKEDKVWNNVQLTSRLPTFCGTTEELDLIARNNSRKCILTTESGMLTRGTRAHTYILGVQSTYALINTHILPDGKFMMEILTCSKDGKSEQTCKIPISRADIVDLANDVSIFDTRKVQFRDITKFLPFTHVSDTEGMFRGTKLSVMKMKGGVRCTGVYGDSILEFPYMYDHEHFSGLCGTPLIAVGPRDRAMIVGIHAAGAGNSQRCYATPLLKDVIEKGVSILANRSCTMLIHSQGAISVPRELPSRKSTFRYEAYPHLSNYGKEIGNVMLNSRTQLVKATPEGMAEFFEETFDYKVKDDLQVPPMKPFMRDDGEYINPYAVGLRAMNNDPALLDRRTMQVVINKLTTRIVNGLRERGIDRMAPLTIQEAINGSPHDAFLRGMNMSTAAGHPFKCMKADLFPLNGEGDDREANERMTRCVLDIMDSYDESVTVSPIVKANLKDEPRSSAKVKAGKTRLFYVLPAPNLVHARMFMAPLYTTMVQHGDLFCTAVGIDMYKGADDLINSLDSFATKFLEGDYSGYDVNNPFDISLIAATIIENVLFEMGYCTEAMDQVRGILSDGLFPVISICGDLVTKAGMQPSGKYATAEDNSLKGLVMLMYFWYSQEALKELDFFEYVLPVIYGDDVVAGLKDEIVGIFNNVTYQAFVRKVYKMDFTSASKSLEIEPYLTLDQISFLKRTFVKHFQSHKWIARLDMSSLEKTLQWYTPSKSVTPAEQIGSAYSSLNYEFFLHSESVEQFEKCQRFLREKYVERFPNKTLTLKSYGTIYREFFEGEVESAPNMEIVDGVYESRWEKISALEGTHYEKYRGKEIDVDFRTVDEREAVIADLQSEIDLITFHLESMNLPFDIDLLLATPDVYKRISLRATYDVPITLARYREDLEVTLKSLKRTATRKSNILFESAFEMNVSSGQEIKEENVEFTSQALDDSNTGFSIYPDIGQRTPVDIARFLERPVEIANFTMGVGTDLSTSYPVWDLFTREPSVRAKLRNFAYLYGDLELEIHVSGTPFHYGKLLVSYQVWDSVNATLTKLLTEVSVDSGMRPLLLNYLSQARGAIIIDVKANTPTKVHCPFICTKPMFALHNKVSTVVSAATPFNDLLYAGELYLYSLNTLRSVSDSPSAVGIQIFAHMSNVQLGCTTGTQLEITTESHLEEIKEGPIERASSAVATMADQLTGIPSISVLAQATKGAAQAMGSVASHYGWSEPSMLDEPYFVKNRPFGNSAMTTGHSTVERVVLDPLQGITVDPRMMGTDEDEMSLASIYTRETYLTSFDWTVDDTPMGNPIFLCRATPQLDTYYENLSTHYYQPTAMSFCAYPFSFWNGSIEFRIEVVCSAFHRGKLAIFFEPNTYQGALISADLKLNKDFLHIIDIQETQDVRLCVNWAQDTLWQTTCSPGQSQYNHGPDFSYTAAPYTVNGYIGVVPFTALQTNDTSDYIEVNVYVRGKELRFNQLSSSKLPTERAILESHMELTPEEIKCVDLNPTTGSLDQCAMYTFGEIPTSFRALLKRYVRTHNLSATATGYHSLTRYTGVMYQHAFPAYGGTAATPHLLGYLPYAYVGVRGSMRKRVRMISDDPRQDYQAMATVSLGDNTNAYALTLTSDHALARQIGSVEFVPSTNSGIEFELPLYTHNMCVVSFSDDMTGSNVMSSSIIRSYVYDNDVNVYVDDIVSVVEDSATGEDFTFLRYNGAPTFSA